tara:strand:- start:23548 stop:23937 length:390 start_codon:yes stop_codon:yes gene_type:complete
MTHESDFTVDITYEDQELTVHGVCEWSVENDSFDYAGTHCTGGRSGIHELPDYCEAASCEIQTIEDSLGNDVPIEDASKLSDINFIVLKALQDEENDSGSEMQSIISAAEDAQVDAYLDNQENKEYYDD